MIPILSLLLLTITLSYTNEIYSGVEPTTSNPTAIVGRPKTLSQLALAVARSSYLPTDRFFQKGLIMENPSHFGDTWLRCPENKPEMQAGLCYTPCNESTWAFVKGVGPLCWGCPTSHPVQQGGLCYKVCPSHRPKGKMFLCFGNCPSGYRNDGLTCFKDGRLRAADNSACPWYDKCGLTFSRGCSKCPSGYKNDGCICRRNPHVTVRPRHHRGIGIPMKSYGRGVGVLPKFLQYDPTSERQACKTKDWVGTSFVNKDTEVVKFVNDRQKMVVFGFRGTDTTSVSDWFVNFNFHPADFLVNNTKLRIHRGFKNRYDNIASWFDQEYARTPREHLILLTGHSQGGAIASIAAVFAAGKLARAPNAVITWGSTLTGAENFRKFYRKYVGCDVTLNYVTKGDFVARFPMVYDYAHACDVVELEPGDQFRAHSLYSGYGEGLERAYGNEIKYGCDVDMPKENDVPSYVLAN